MSQEIFVVGVPTLLILVGLFFNWRAAVDIRSEMRGGLAGIRSEIAGVRSEMRAGFDKVDAHFVTVEGDLRHFYAITGELKGRLDTIEKK